MVLMTIHDELICLFRCGKRSGANLLELLVILEVDMENIFIPQLLKMPEQTHQFQLNDYISELKTLTPIKGNFQVTHHHNFLEVKLKADTILTLTCDRCLQTFNHRLTVDTTEIILLQNPPDEALLPLEREIISEDLWEALPPNGELAVEEWIYEQLSLAMPLRNLCGNDCQPPQREEHLSKMKIDDRWSALANLKSIMPE